MAANNMVDIKQQIEKSVSNLPNNNYLLGRGLMTPFNPANSGSRKIMSITHKEHSLVPFKGEMALIQTGYESEFGRKSSCYIKANANYNVIAKIPKFSFKPDDHYYLIIQNTDNGQYDVIERVSYNHNTESYGYMNNNATLDSYKPGSKIKASDVIKTSNGFDEFGNRIDGINLTTMYLSCDQNMEDSIIISESAAEKLSMTLVHTPDVIINENDILLNLYGDDNNYKAFPDIGEHTKDGILCATRRLENDTIFFSLARNRLNDIMMSDSKKTVDGIVVDINVHCNNVAALGDSYYNQQLYFYYQENIKFCTAINNLVGPWAVNHLNMSYKLKKLYVRCRDILAGKQFFKEKQFNNVWMEVTLIEKLPVHKGDKLSDRYGGKGVVSEIRPDALMPRLDNGTIVDCIKNQSTCINRENLGQLYEQSLTFMGSRIIDYFNLGVLTYPEMAKIWYDFAYEIEPGYANYATSSFNIYDEYEAKIFIESIMDQGGIALSIEPFTNNITLDKLDSIYKKFPWIKPYEVLVPIKDSNDNIRYINTRRSLIIGKIFNFRLKQYAEEKFSVTSLSATNQKGLNSRSKANKEFNAKFTKTPIMFGAMETGDMAHVGMEYVIMNLMLYSSSPRGRRLFERLLVGDPYNINIKLDADSKNRNAEIINTIFKTMGLRLRFIKKPKEHKEMARKIMARPVCNRGYKEYDIGFTDRETQMQLRHISAMNDMNNKPLARKILARRVDK